MHVPAATGMSMTEHDRHACIRTRINEAAALLEGDDGPSGGAAVVRRAIVATRGRATVGTTKAWAVAANAAAATASTTSLRLLAAALLLVLLLLVLLGPSIMFGWMMMGDAELDHCWARLKCLIVLWECREAWVSVTGRKGRESGPIQPRYLASTAPHPAPPMSAPVV